MDLRIGVTLVVGYLDQVDVDVAAAVLIPTSTLLVYLLLFVNVAAEGLSRGGFL